MWPQESPIVGLLFTFHWHCSEGKVHQGNEDVYLKHTGNFYTSVHGNYYTSVHEGGERLHLSPQ